MKRRRRRRRQPLVASDLPESPGSKPAAAPPAFPREPRPGGRRFRSSRRTLLVGFTRLSTTSGHQKQLKMLESNRRTLVFPSSSLPQ